MVTSYVNGKIVRHDPTKKRTTVKKKRKMSGSKMEKEMSYMKPAKKSASHKMATRKKMVTGKKMMTYM